MLLTEVSDTGEGIPQEEQKLLFNRFQQAASRTLHHKGQGTGLGLYISSEFVKAMGGRLWLEKSQPGAGSTFAFTLPLISSTTFS